MAAGASIRHRIIACDALNLTARGASESEGFVARVRA
jgi:hypothetical protein